MLTDHIQGRRNRSLTPNLLSSHPLSFVCLETSLPHIFPPSHESETTTMAGALSYGKQIPCPDCDFETNSSSQWAHHRIDHHEDLKPFRCSQCGFQTDRFKYLKAHGVGVHATSHAGDIKQSDPFVCRCVECGFERR